MNWLFIQGLLRHILTFGGGWLTAEGIADPEAAKELTGGIIAVAGAIWSIVDKKKRS